MKMSIVGTHFLIRELAIKWEFEREGFGNIVSVIKGASRRGTILFLWHSVKPFLIYRPVEIFSKS